MVLAELAILVVSVIVLARASSLVVDNAVKLSVFFKISQLAVGFLLIAVATSLPELSVSVVSSAVGDGAIAAGNVFGSNIANILLILGIGSVLYGVKISSPNLKGIGLVLLLTTLVSTYIVFNGSVQQHVLGFVEGSLLVALFAAYAWYTIKKNKVEEKGGNHAVTKKEALTAFLMFSAGIIVVIASSGFVVESAVKLARLAGVAESFIGATIIAVGTSLPELSVDIQALRKKRYGLALGDAIGSNMVNITLVLGVAAVINPISVQIPVFIAALLFAVIANSLLFYVAAVNKGIKRRGGALFLALYAVYLITIFLLQLKETAAA
ncbi:MAG: sodium:calcium antiporter [Candidatus Micrarchaeota archaeon]|nr:sodium:calcium antiporter [Candidatus Micrarchaeota archaeon]